MAVYLTQDQVDALIKEIEDQYEYSSSQRGVRESEDVSRYIFQRWSAERNRVEKYRNRDIATLFEKIDSLEGQVAGLQAESNKLMKFLWIAIGVILLLVITRWGGGHSEADYGARPITTVVAGIG